MGEIIVFPHYWRDPATGEGFYITEAELSEYCHSQVRALDEFADEVDRHNEAERRRAGGGEVKP